MKIGDIYCYGIADYELIAYTDHEVVLRFEHSKRFDVISREAFKFYSYIGPKPMKTKLSWYKRLFRWRK